MTADIRGLIDTYVAWIRDNSSLRQLGDDYVEITTPFLDRHNDHLQIYVRSVGSELTLTDDGEVIADLEMSGCDLDTPKRKQLLLMTVNGFGVQIDRQNHLSVTATSHNFASKKHNLVQAMLAVNDLFYLAETSVANLFFEDVERWFKERDIRFTPNIKLMGKSGLDHKIDFAIPASNGTPERLVRAVSNPNRQSVESLAFLWIDTRELRSPGAKLYALLNDEVRPARAPILQAFREIDVQPVPWSLREKTLPELSA